MRINRFIALSTGVSRRAADALLTEGRVQVNSRAPTTGQAIQSTDHVTLDGRPLEPFTTQTILFHKPVGYITSREGQGGRTIYDLLPPELRHLKPVGRLDKDSSGLLLMTNDGELAHTLTHPSFHKLKMYEVQLDLPLQPLHRQMISEHGLQLEDGPSKLTLEPLSEDGKAWRVTMREGRNRQIRRTFDALGYTVVRLRRTQFGNYRLGSLKPGTHRLATPSEAPH